MSNKNTIIDENYQYYPIIIGDILLHSERKSTPILIITQSLIPRKSSSTINKSDIPRILTNSSEIENLCDLKNSTTVPLTHQRTLSAKQFTLIHQTCWTLIKNIKSKVITINNKQLKSVTSNANSSNNNKQTHF